MYIERSRSGTSYRRRQTKIGTNNVIHAGVVEPIEQIETFGYKLEIGFFGHLKPASDTHVE